MKILIAEDEPVTAEKLESLVKSWGYELRSAQRGRDAWSIMNEPDAPSLVVLDWQLPGMSGVEICRRARKELADRPIYIILLTGVNTSSRDAVKGLDAGADDFLTKPYDTDELHARISVGARVVRLERDLFGKIHELEEAMSHIKQLRGLLPICSYCKKIRDDNNYWTDVERYIIGHSDAKFTHGICPSCYKKVKRELKGKMAEEDTR